MPKGTILDMLKKESCLNYDFVGENILYVEEPNEFPKKLFGQQSKHACL
jgi:hypothetical protein